MSDRRRLLKIVAAVVLVGTIAAVWQSGLLDGLDRARLSGWAERAGWWGPLAFVALFALGELLHVPSVIFVVVAGIVWPWTVALPTAFVGAMVASAVVFVVARYLVSGTVQDLIQQRMPPAMKRYEQALVDRGIRTVAIIRLLTFMAPLMHWLLATSRVRFGDMMVGTALGLLPGVTVLVLAGDAAIDHWETARPYVLSGAVLFVLVRVVSRARNRRAEATPAATTPAVTRSPETPPPPP